MMKRWIYIHDNEDRNFAILGAQVNRRPWV